MDMVELTIEQANRLLITKCISPEELISEYYKWISKIEPEILAWALLREEELVLKDIETIRKNKRVTPLSFLPYGVKDIFFTKGIATEAGSQTLKGFVPDKNATVIDKLVSSGALLIGKTTTAEFASGGGAPATRNPWNLLHTPGGSSTGSAAAVASGMSLFSLGTQTSGSVMRPASYNGLTALKPTFGIISKAGIFPASWSIDTVGIFTKNVKDITFVFNEIKGYDNHDPYSIKQVIQKLNLSKETSDKRFRIGMIKDAYFTGAEEVMARFEEAIKIIEKQGHTILPCMLPKDFELANRAHAIVVDSETAAFHQEHLDQNYPMFSEELKQDIQTGMSYTALDYIKAQQLRETYKGAIRELFKEVDLLITPTTPETAPEGLKKTGSPKFNVPFSNAGLPTLTLPIGLSEKGLPIGMQIIADDFCEQKLMDLGIKFQQETDFHLNKPMYI
ncbi:MULTISPECIES: amidase [unclassified Enterococcus]|uniref:amidase n=1 Tax=unclassified Enterococcus TaxID=2608891 RepID=UPI001CE08923|nr:MULTISPECIES: amidase [unclassified Enterococcus]MCA5013672.1 amidase [Enterococcus sp. S23]MCA5016922.1 amidase [Enterococcus sp. S22(2020)]